jgi:hypothetical protein
MNKEKVKEELKWERKKSINEMVTYQTLWNRMGIECLFAYT